MTDADLILALRLTSGALAIVAKNAGAEQDTIRFTGASAHLGSHTVSAILDRANRVLPSPEAAP